MKRDQLHTPCSTIVQQIHPPGNVSIYSDDGSSKLFVDKYDVSNYY